MNTLVLRRRLFYICAMVALLIPLYFMGHPSVRDQDGVSVQQGGSLAAIRSNYDLNHSDLGALDPASESARLATLGLRGVAATILWQRAEHYKREKYFDRLSATVNQLRILQPHYVKVWEFQAHNLAWNVSVEFDDYRQRYEWVKKGMDFLIDGAKYNKTRTEMPFELGWAFGNKLGMSDERIQFRELFREDRNFHNEVEAKSRMDLLQPAAQGPDGKPDNWRCGALWYERAYDMVDAGSRPARSPLMFYVKAPQWHYKHAEAIQTDGYLGEEARTAWRLAGAQWREFGQRQVKTTYGTTIFLNELDTARQRLVQLQDAFHQFCGDTYTSAQAALKQSLSPEQQAALEKSVENMKMDELRLAESARMTLEIPPMELANAVTAEKQLLALEMANQITLQTSLIDHIERYRDQVNYGYWESRCLAEQDDSALAARSSMYQADKLLDVGKLQEALDSYDQAWVDWRNLFNRYPAVMIDDAADQVVAAIDHYLRIRDIPEPPADFPLNKFLRFRQLNAEMDGSAKPAVMSLISEWPKRFPGRNFLDDLLVISEADKAVEGTSDPAINSVDSSTADGAEVDSSDKPEDENSADQSALDDQAKPQSSQDENAPTATDPPATDRPATDPPATDPPATDRPVADPSSN